MQLNVGDQWSFPEGWSLRFTHHAQSELGRREIHADTVRSALRTNGVVVEAYPPSGYPHWNHLLLFEALEGHLHILIALDETDREVIVVTGYRPDPSLWEPGSRRRKQ